jgi:hypothetical protein
LFIADPQFMAIQVSRRHEIHALNLLIILRNQIQEGAKLMLSIYKAAPSPCCHGLPARPGARIHPWQRQVQIRLLLFFLYHLLMSVDLLGLSPTRKLLDILLTLVSLQFHWILPIALIGFLLDSECW